MPVEPDPEVVSRAGQVLAQHSRFIRENSRTPTQHSRGETVSPPAPAAPSEPSNESVSEAAQATTETPPQAAPAAPEEPTTPQAYKLRLSGKEVEMPREHVEALLAKVHSVDQESQKLEAARAAFAMDLSFSEWAKTATPEQRAALQSLLQGGPPPQPSRRQAAADDDDEDEDDGPAPSAPNAPPDYEQVKRALHTLMGREEKRMETDARVQRDASIGEAMGKYRVFKDTGLSAIARQAIEDKLAANPKLDPLATVAATAAEYGAWLESVSKSAGPTPAVARGSANGSPAGDTPVGTFTAKDMRDGKVRDAVLAALRSGKLQRR